MKCLSPERIYSHLDGLLSAGEARQVEDHLSSCAACRVSVEERRRLTLAAERLPDLELPPDFAARVMAAIEPQRVPLGSVAAAFAIGVVSMFFAMAGFLLTTGGWSGRFLSGINQAGWGGLKNASLLFARFVALFAFAGRLLRYVLAILIKGFVLVASLFSPGAQAAAIVLSLILLAGLWLAARRGRLIGDQS